MPDELYGLGKTIWVFLCPNIDGFHPKGEYVEYLMIHGLKLHRKKDVPKDGWGDVYTYNFTLSQHDFVLIDQPADAMCTAVYGALPGAKVWRQKRVCLSCHNRGIKR